MKRTMKPFYLYVCLFGLGLWFVSGCSSSGGASPDAAMPADLSLNADSPMTVDSPMIVDSSAMRFDPSKPQSLQTEEGVGVQFVANALVTASGASPTGSVTAELHAVLSGESSPADMPGGFAAVDVDGKQVTLVSYGVIEIDFTDDAGNALELREDGSAMITIPALASGPSSIPLWWLDEQTNIWHEEGTATLTDGAYVGEVNHFSYWNADGRCEQACLSGRIIDSNGAPAAGVDILARLQSTNCDQWREGALSGGAGTSGADGTFQLDALVRDSIYNLSAGTAVKSGIIIPAFSGDCVQIGDLVQGTLPVPDGGIADATSDVSAADVETTDSMTPDMDGGITDGSSSDAACTPYATCSEALTASDEPCNSAVADGCGGVMDCGDALCQPNEGFQTECIFVLDPAGTGGGYNSCKIPCTVDQECPTFTASCFDSSTLMVGGWWCEEGVYCSGIQGLQECLDPQGNPAPCVEDASGASCVVQGP